MSTPITSFKLLDGTSIPWLAWGNGTSDAKKTAVVSGQTALAAGIRHLDTAQIYFNEAETGEAISKAGLKPENVYVTSKIFGLNTTNSPLPLSDVRASVESSISRLGFIPNQYLIHTPTLANPGELKAFWKIFEDLKDEGKLKSIGVSNFRPQDLEQILDGAKYKPVVNQIEYHPFTHTHLEPLLELQAKHGIVTTSYGILTPLIRHPAKGGPLIPVLKRIASRLSSTTAGKELQEKTGREIDEAAVLLLWARERGVVAVTASGNAERIKWLAEISRLPEGILEKAEVEEILNVGKTIHFRHYRGVIEKDFPLPNLPDGTNVA